MTPHKNPEAAVSVADHLGELLRQEFWIVLKAFFAPIIGTVAVLGHLREVIRLTDRPDI